MYVFKDMVMETNKCYIILVSGIHYYIEFLKIEDGMYCYNILATDKEIVVGTTENCFIPMGLVTVLGEAEGIEEYVSWFYTDRFIEILEAI